MPYLLEVVVPGILFALAQDTRKMCYHASRVEHVLASAGDLPKLDIHHVPNFSWEDTKEDGLQLQVHNVQLKLELADNVSGGN